MVGMIKETITEVGQPYVDIAKYAQLLNSPLRDSIRLLCGKWTRTPIVIVLGYQRNLLNWVEPDKGART